MPVTCSASFGALRDNAASRRFSAFWVKDGTVLAGMHANGWDAIGPIKRIVGQGQADLARLRDPGVPLEQLTG